MTTFTQSSLDFLYFNHKYNSKLWYAEHKEDFKQYLAVPFRDLVTAMSPRMLEIDDKMITEPKSIVSRLYKDLRFAKDKTSLYAIICGSLLCGEQTRGAVCRDSFLSCPLTNSAMVADTIWRTQKAWQVCAI